jgi:hypothetical protein
LRQIASHCLLLSFRTLSEAEGGGICFFHTASCIWQKIFQKVGMFLDSEKVSVNTPQSPRNSPQLHHDLPAQKHQETQKPPAKPPSTTPKKILPKSVH